MLEFPNTLESKWNIETTSPSCDMRKPSDGEFGRKWLYLKRKTHTVYYFSNLIAMAYKTFSFCDITPKMQNSFESLLFQSLSLGAKVGETNGFLLVSIPTGV